MAKLPLIPLELPPGIFRNGTRYAVKNRWYDGSQVRWLDNIMQPIGGWAAITTAALAHPARGMFAWRTNEGGRWYTVGTSTQLIVGDGSSSTWDVTPVGFTAGSDSGVDALGFGGSTYGSSTYGTPRPSGLYTPPMSWQMDNWGEDLVATALGDGKIYQWSLATGTPAAVVANAPTNNLGLLVTDQQHLMALGAGGNGRLLQWSDVEANTVWTPSTTNEAGQIQLQTPGTIQCGVRVRGVNLILTDCDAHIANYLGQPLIFARKKIGDKCGIIGPKAVVCAGDIAYWMSDKRFWFFDGSAVQEAPCDVADYVFNNINLTQSAKVYAGSNGAFEEVTWFYCSTAATEPDSYVSFNYRNGFWMIGSLPRTSWIDKDVFPTPMAVGVDGYIYNQETGVLANGSSRVSQVYVETSGLEVGEGERVIEVNQVLPDEAVLGQTQITFRGRFTPGGTEYSYGPFLARTDGWMDVDGTAGRQIIMNVTPAADVAWEFGEMRWDARQTSER